MYCVYVLQRQDGKLYIGQTENLEKRLADHRDGSGARFTVNQPFTLLGHVEVDTRSAELFLEKKLKAYKNPFRVKQFLGRSPDSESGLGNGL